MLGCPRSPYKAPYTREIFSASRVCSEAPHEALRVYTHCFHHPAATSSTWVSLLETAVREGMLVLQRWMHRHISWVIRNYGRIAHGHDSSSRARASVKRQGCICHCSIKLAMALCEHSTLAVGATATNNLPVRSSGETETGITRPHFGSAVRRSKRQKVRRLSDS